MLVFLATDDERHQQAMLTRYGSRLVQQNDGRISRSKGTAAIWMAPSSANAHAKGEQVNPTSM